MPTKFSSEAALREAEPDQPLYAPIKRRSFFLYAGATAGATALVLAGCDKSDSSPGTIDVGAGDAGILNYAYALEQLEAAFYAQVKTGDYYKGLGPTSAEKQIFDDLALHEAIHRDFLKAALQANSITPLKDLTPDFSSISFGDRTSVLAAAQTFEDTGVAAYNGAGRFLTSNTNLALAGKIVSVEARHAALIRDLRAYNSFVGSDVVNTFTPNIPATGGYSGEGTPNTTANTQGNGNPGPGQERSKRPPQILQAVNNFLATGSKLSADSFA